ncbi:TetR family transcriptional regulator C-terminal domain-containing protein [Mycolicibacterium rufum]|uniref:TetR family transcriptional regulator C-terminal domain-containing protein n=1 Tax=Mycolicibacterium rufum TaxID=318424 RepID=A0ABY3UB56_9MYCO|nr:TetR family transcriptional regulator C-terminal domain-containing protein [Mycolicibacterium rufum]ULP35680.1 TetR family transcriptional regulator C-terminal domain-containing protein [Mycolicibacterium rufum]
MTGAVRDAKRKLPAERRGELLGRAVQIARTEGLSAVTLRRVAADLGVTPGLVSHYFAAAEQLTAAAFRAAAQQDLDAANARVEAQPTASAKILALIDYMLADDGDDGSALWLETWTLARRNPVLAAEADELTAQWVARIADIVAAGVEAGEFTVDGRVDAVARRVLTLIDGLGSQKVVRAVPAAEATQIARTYVQSELRGITSPR